jgi:hypothetical protein
MKTLTLASSYSLVALVLAGTPAFAQSGESTSAEQETLVGYHRAETTRVTGWFVAPTFATTSFASQLGYLPGLRGGIYLNQRFAVGVTANVLATQDSHVGDHDGRNVGTYGGLLLQYVVHSNQVLHASLESTLASGRWCNTVGDGKGTAPDGCSGRTFLAFEPVANLELNVARHVRVATGVGYRFAVAAKGDGPSSGDLSGIVARTSVVFGSF